MNACFLTALWVLPLGVWAQEASTPVRDPFWPADYEGTRHVISAEPRILPVAETTTTNVVENSQVPQPVAVKPIQPEAPWNDALKLLKFGGLVRRKVASGAEVTAVLINGRARQEGDLVKVDYENQRFIWRVASSGANRKLKLSRVKVLKLEEEDKNKGAK